MQMAVMDKVLSGFLDNFDEDAEEDKNRRWTEEEGRRLLINFRDFLDNLQNVLCDGLLEECMDVANRYWPGQVRERLEAEAAAEAAAEAEADAKARKATATATATPTPPPTLPSQHVPTLCPSPSPSPNPSPSPSPMPHKRY